MAQPAEGGEGSGMDKIRMSRQAEMLAISHRCPEDLARKTRWCLHDFVLVKRLGVGGASAVYQAISRSSGFCVALKLYFKRKMTLLNVHQVHREVRIHIQLDHPNIVDLWGAFEDEDHVVLVVDYAAKGDLFDMLRQTGGRMKESDVVTRIMYPFMSGLCYLHSLNIIHRDIKLENTLFAFDGTLKIADFGLSIDNAQERPVTRLGTLDYMSPEVMICPDKRLPDENKDLSHLTYTNKIDAWACGVLAYELLVGCPPFGMSTRDGSVKAIMCQQPKIPQWLPSSAADFILWALTKQASQRPIASIPFLPLKYLSPAPHMPAVPGVYPPSHGYSTEVSPLMLPNMRQGGVLPSVQHDLSACSMQSSNTDFAHPYNESSSQVDYMYSAAPWPALNVQDMLMPVSTVPVAGQTTSTTHNSSRERTMIQGMNESLVQHDYPAVSHGRDLHALASLDTPYMHDGTASALASAQAKADSGAMPQASHAAHEGLDACSQDLLLNCLLANGQQPSLSQLQKQQQRSHAVPNADLQPLAANADRMHLEAAKGVHAPWNGMSGVASTSVFSHGDGGNTYSTAAPEQSPFCVPNAGPEQPNRGRSSMQVNRNAHGGRVGGLHVQPRDSALMRCASACVRMPHTTGQDPVRPDETHRSYWEASGMGFKPMGVWEDSDTSPPQQSPNQMLGAAHAQDYSPAGVYAVSDKLEQSCCVKAGAGVPAVEPGVHRSCNSFSFAKAGKRNLATRAEPWISSGGHHSSMHGSSSSTQLHEQSVGMPSFSSRMAMPMRGQAYARGGVPARPKSAMLAMHPQASFGLRDEGLQGMPIFEQGVGSGGYEAATAAHAMLAAGAAAATEDSMDVLSCSPSFLRPVKRPLFRKPAPTEVHARGEQHAQA